jgi:hypothetical protein
LILGSLLLLPRLTMFHHTVFLDHLVEPVVFCLHVHLFFRLEIVYRLHDLLFGHNIVGVFAHESAEVGLARVV